MNCQGKFAVKQKNGSKVLVKLANNAIRSYPEGECLHQQTELTDYTIQADVMGSEAREDMPDIGAWPDRYTLMLDGNKQRLRLLSWDALPRVDKSIDWPWKPGVWYHLKLAMEVQGDKAIARGKAWQRDQSEPAAWTIEFEDPMPQPRGKPRPLRLCHRDHR